MYKYIMNISVTLITANMLYMIRSICIYIYIYYTYTNTHIHTCIYYIYIYSSYILHRLILWIICSTVGLLELVLRQPRGLRLRTIQHA